MRARWAAGCAVLLLLQVIGAAFPGERLWGLHLFRFVPAWLIVLTAALYLFAAAGPYLFRPAGDRKRKPPEESKYPLAAIAVAVVLFIGGMLFRPAVQLLGNSADISHNLQNVLKGFDFQSGVLYGTQPLSTALYLSLVKLAGASLHPDRVFLIVGLLAGIVTVFGAWRLSGSVSADRRIRFAVMTVVLAVPPLLFFFGHVEFYTLMYACLVWYFAFALEALDDKGPLWIPLVLLALASAFHITALLLLPSALLLVYRRITGKGVSTRNVLVTVALSAAAGLAWYFLSDQHLGKGFFIPFAADPDGTSYTLLSSMHLLDILNLLCFYLPVIAVTVAAALASPETERDEGAAGFAILSVGFPLLFICSWNSLLGMARDWDVASFFGISVAAAFVVFLRTRPAFLPVLRRWRAPVAALALAVVVPWIAANTSSYHSLLRFYDLLMVNAPYTDRQGTVTGWEHVRQLYEKLGDRASELSVTREMIRYSRDPDDVLKLMRAVNRDRSVANARSMVDDGLTRLKEILRLQMAGKLDAVERDAVRRNFSRALIPCLDYYTSTAGPAEAMKIAESLRREFPDAPSGYTAMAFCHMTQSRFPECLAQGTEAVRREPTDGVAHTAKGFAEMNLGMIDSARASYARALAVKPVYAIAYYGLGLLQLFKDKDSARALENFRLYIDHHPDDQNAKRLIESLTR